MTVRKRIAHTLAANTFGQAITVGAQLLLTPLYFSTWGASQFGEWLLLSTIPAYLAMADIGVGSAAANEMVMRVNARDYAGAQSSFWGAVRICNFASLFALAVSLVMGLLAWKGLDLPLPSIGRDASASIILLLGVGVCVNFYLSTVASGFRSGGKNALGILYANTLRLVEFLATAVMLLLQTTPLHLCAGLLLLRCLGLVVQTLLLRGACDWIFRPGYQTDRLLLKRLLKPSLSFLALPLGNALALQGPVLIIGMLFGSSAVASFSTLRTLSRLPLQIANVFNASVWPEMSAAFGANNLAMLRKLHQQAWLGTLVLGLLASTSIALLGKTVVGLWLGSLDLYDASTLMTLTAMATLTSVWGVSSTVLAAINAHSRLVLVYMVANSGCLSLAYLLGTWLGMAWFLAPLVLAELTMLLVVYPMALRATGDSIPRFMHSEWQNVHRVLQTLRA